MFEVMDTLVMTVWGRQCIPKKMFQFQLWEDTLIDVHLKIVAQNVSQDRQLEPELFHKETKHDEV